MKLSELLFFLVTFFDKREQLIEYHSQHCHRLIQDCGQNTEDHDGHDHEIQLEDLAAVDDEEAKACLGGEKLADDDADEAETYIDFQVTDDGRDAGRKNNIAKNISACAAKGPDEQ